MLFGDGRVRTDLVLEAKEMFEEKAGKSGQTNFAIPPGVTSEEENDGSVHVSKIKVISPEGEKHTGKPMGTYITVECDDIKRNDRQSHEKVCSALAKALASMLNLNETASVLVAGLGNWNVTPDALGPKVTSTMLVTRHLLEFLPGDIKGGIRPVSAISPGVLGITGIETGEIVKGVVERANPDAVILIDALASRKIDRIGTTIQLADTGISPGSGVGNRRMELSSNTLGRPVIAMGVPTVVDAATMANDIIEQVIDGLMKSAPKEGGFYSMLKSMGESDRYQMIWETMQPWTRNMIVTPKEVDELISNLSKTIANAINMALHKSISIEQLDRYLN